MRLDAVHIAHATSHRHHVDNVRTPVRVDVLLAGADVHRHHLAAHQCIHAGDGSGFRV